MIVYFDTVKRKRPVKEGGDLVKLDWGEKKILKSVSVYPSDPDIDDDPNPRGNSRGGKGILVYGDELVVGAYHTLLVFDRDLQFKRKITNPLFVNIHEICSEGENIWVSATTIDCAVLVDRLGRTLKTWWPREDPLLQRTFGLQPMAIDKNADNRLKYLHAELSTKEHHTHLNGVITGQNKTYVLLNKLGTVVQIAPEVKIALQDDDVRGAHSLKISGDGRQMILCSSLRREILFYDLPKGLLEKKIRLLDFAPVARLHHKSPDQPFNRSIFVRGLEIIGQDRILVGISPASILEIDWQRDCLLDFYQHSADVGDAVHGLAHIKT